ncbi:MAG: sterol desaturase family protein [Calditrichaeota bacterium]|nr:sterol desaturase family protein [Calditrichota bacterium]
MTDQIFYIVFFSMFFLFCLIDLVYRQKDYPKLKLWRSRGLIFYALYVYVAFNAPLLWDEWLSQYRLVDATSLTFGAQFILGFSILQLGIYAWHRTMHSTHFLWRTFHQLHHSAERLDIFGAFYFHPLDMLGFTFVSSLMLVLVVGIGGEAAAYIALLATFYGIFQHANIKTPKWLGYFIQRPENHSLHHARDVHGYNYSDLPIWDIVFGTFKQVDEFQEVGIHDGSSDQIGSLLIAKDISR